MDGENNIKYQQRANQSPLIQCIFYNPKNNEKYKQHHLAKNHRHKKSGKMIRVIAFF